MDKRVMGSIGIIIFFGIAFYLYSSLMSPTSIQSKFNKCQQVMVSGDSTNRESMRTFSKLDNTVQNSNYPNQFKREVSNCYVWLNTKTGDTRSDFIKDINEVFINLNSSLNTVVTYDKNHNISQ